MSDAMPTPPAKAITEASLQTVVDTFYGKVRLDPMIGPIFNNAIDDWPEHLDRLQAFWSSVMLGSGRYKGRPLPAHIKHGDSITPAMFHRWLALWRETALELLSGPAAAAMQEKAMRIAESLQMGIAFHKDGGQSLAALDPARRRAD